MGPPGRASPGLAAGSPRSARPGRWNKWRPRAPSAVKAPISRDRARRAPNAHVGPGAPGAHPAPPLARAALIVSAIGTPGGVTGAVSAEGPQTRLPLSPPSRRSGRRESSRCHVLRKAPGGRSSQARLPRRRQRTAPFKRSACRDPARFGMRLSARLIDESPEATAPGYCWVQAPDSRRRRLKVGVRQGLPAGMTCQTRSLPRPFKAAALVRIPLGASRLDWLISAGKPHGADSRGHLGRARLVPPPQADTSSVVALVLAALCAGNLG